MKIYTVTFFASISAMFFLRLGEAKGQLVLTEFLANPSVLVDDDGEYFEVFNAGPTDIAVDGLTISDDGTDSFTFDGTGLVIGAGEFFVFGDLTNTDDPSYVDAAWDGGFFLANGADEIVVSDTSGELLRLNYTDGDPFGAGTAAVLNNVFNDSSDENNFIAEVTTIGSNTGGTNTDLGSPGVAGATAVTAVPEPSSSLIAIAGLGTVCFRRRR